MPRRFCWPFFASLLLALSNSCSREQTPPAPAAEITVAAAANLTDAFDELSKDFTTASGVRVVLSYGGTADLAKQIENGGPFDVFAAADTQHPTELETKGLLTPGTRALYGRGKLVLWVPPGSKVRVARLEDLANAEVKTVAMAKPELAPYGKASVESLRALGLWTQVEPKAVYGQNVSQTRQFASSGNADAAFIPLSLVKKNSEGQVIAVDEKLHTPIEQAIGVVKASNKQEAARRFVDYVLSEKGQALLERYGYGRVGRG
ncbi:MAG TPA: molybdate ABC transporter substrate-binding protein [Pyrinomonadaceae bacterium]|nr:molybdate ABC transporter substrate-binding protein [Pyrinomonadaceae bacterium]